MEATQRCSDRWPLSEWDPGTRFGRLHMEEWPLVCRFLLMEPRVSVKMIGVEEMIRLGACLRGVCKALTISGRTKESLEEPRSRFVWISSWPEAGKRI